MKASPDIQTFFNPVENSPPFFKSGMRANSSRFLLDKYALTGLETVSPTPVKAWESFTLNKNTIDIVDDFYDANERFQDPVVNFSNRDQVKKILCPVV